MRRRVLLAVTLAGLLAGAPASATVRFQDRGGLHVVSVKQQDPRLVTLVVKTAALPDPANIYILFPPGYAQHPKRRYPVSYLLHGTSGTASDWTLKGNAEQVIGDRQLLRVMPDSLLAVAGGR